VSSVWRDLSAYGVPPPV
jgi:hypothetical protein